MLWVGATILSVLIIGAFAFSHREDLRYRLGDFAFVVAFVLVIGQFAGFAATAAAIDSSSYDHRTTVSQNIVSLNDGTGTSGRFFLGSGYMDDHPTYFYYTGDGFNGFRASTVNADWADIKYTSGTPHMEAYCQDWTKASDWTYIPGWRWGSVPDSLNDPGCTDDYGNIDVWVTFYVPPGSVQQNYSLDSQ